MPPATHPLPSRVARRRRTGRVAVVMAVVAVLGAACTADDGDEAGVAGPQQPEATAPGTSGDEPGGRRSEPTADLADCPAGHDVEDPRASQAAETAVGVDHEDVDGIGDPTLPDLGDPRLDVIHTGLELVVEDGALTTAAATLTVGVTEPTDEVAFDLVGLDVTGVLVDGEATDAERVGAKLVVPFGSTLAPGDEAEVIVCYRGTPTPIESDAVYGATVGWVAADEGTFVLAEPEAGRTWFPANEHPTDKSTFTFSITVDAGLVALANGVLVGGPVPCTGDLRIDGDDPGLAAALDGADESCGKGTARDGGDGSVTWRWDMAAPMASYLATVVIGDYQREVHPAVGDVPVEVWFTADESRSPRAFAASSEIVAFLAEVLGPYPFASAGNVVLPGLPDDPFLQGVAFEAQSMNIYAPDTVVEPIVVHETAHQWFGDSVSVRRWSEDLWWVEGFATYAEWLWAEAEDGPEAYDAQVERAAHVIDDDPGEVGHLEPDALFEALAYDGGAVVFHALRVEVGDEAFFEVLRTFADRYRHDNAGTDDLVAVASEVSGQDLTRFFAAWLDTADRPAVPR